MLEARKKAEKVWYQVVWEEAKDASNVIDYSINEEITKDKSAEQNANNQTTTGMANVIPWVNAPKLIAKTSIIWDLWWGWWEVWFKAKIIQFTSSYSLTDAQAILEAYLDWYWVIPVMNLSDVAFRYYYPWYMHYSRLVFVFNWEWWVRTELKITYSWTTATWFSET